MPTLFQMLHSFKESLSNSTSHTTYRNSCTTIAVFLEETGQSELSISALIDFWTWLVEKQYAMATVNGYVHVFRKFLTFAMLKKQLPINIYEEILDYWRLMAPPVGKIERRTIDQKAINAILTYYEQPEDPFLSPGLAEKTMIYLRTRALVYTLAFTGLRINEALSLPVQPLRLFFHIWDETQFFETRIEGKGRKYRTTILMPVSLFPVRDWIEARSAYFPQILSMADDFRPLFVSVAQRGRKSADRRITRQTAWNDIQSTASFLGLDSFTGPHAFRHFWAELLAQNDTALQDIASYLGNTIQVVADHYAQPQTAKTMARIGAKALPR